MARRKITQSDVAVHLGFSTAAVSRRLRGVVPFDVNELDALASLLGVPITTFVAEQPVSEQVPA